MIIHNAEFICSNTSYLKCPGETIPEYAFIGRSNVGKSSLINSLVNKKGMAKTSSTPGKTQLINHFLVNKDFNPWFLVDLPGYGYAKTSKTNLVKWEKLINDYLLNRKNLLCVFVLIDIRHEPQKIDLEFLEWLGENALSFVIVFTKSDKLTKNKVSQNVKVYKDFLQKDWEEIPQSFVTSAEEKLGLEDILNFIETNNQIIPS
jgi:GTP-binding protein